MKFSHRVNEIISDQKPNRPFIVSLICVLGFFFTLSAVFGLFFPSSRTALAEYGILRPSIAYLKIIIALIAFIGYWKMKRYGVYLYVAMTFSGIIVNLGIFGAIYLPFQYVHFLIIIIGLIYFKRMS